MFSNREIATFTWIVVLTLCVLRNKEVRNAVQDLFKNFFKKKIASSFLIVMVYSTSAILILKYFKFWEVGMVKDVIIWTLFSAFAFMFKSVTKKSEEGIFKEIILDYVKVVVIFEFIINLYSFNVWIELILIPVVGTIVALRTFVELKEEYAQTAKFMLWLEALVGIVIIAFTVENMYLTQTDIVTTKNIKSFLLPIIITSFYIPLLYVFAVYSFYEDIFIRLEMGPKKSDELKSYAKRKIFQHNFFSLNSLRQFYKLHSYGLLKATEKKDIDLLI